MVDKIGIYYMYTKHVFDQQIGVKAPSNVTILTLHISVSDFREKK